MIGGYRHGLFFRFSNARNDAVGMAKVNFRLGSDSSPVYLRLRGARLLKPFRSPTPPAHETVAQVDRANIYTRAVLATGRTGRRKKRAGVCVVVGAAGRRSCQVAHSTAELGASIQNALDLHRDALPLTELKDVDARAREQEALGAIIELKQVTRILEQKVFSIVFLDASCD